MADETKTTKSEGEKSAKASSPAEKKQTHTYEKGRFKGVTVGGVNRAHFFGKSSYEAKAGEIVHMKMGNGDTYAGKVEECVKADGEVCISFVKDKLERLSEK